MTELQLRALRKDVQNALTRIDSLIEAASEEAPLPDEAVEVQALPRTKAIEWVLARSQGKSLRPIEIWAALHLMGRDDPKMEVQVTTYDLWERGRVGKSGRGQYHAL